MRSWLAVASALALAGCGVAERAQHDAPTARHTTVTPPGRTAAQVALRPDPSASAEAAVWSFYHAISTHDYARAWSRLGPALHRSFGGLAEWRAGYRTTVSVSATDVDALTATPENARVSLNL